MAASHNVYRKLYTRLWRHRGFITLTDRARLLTLYLLTGPQTNSIGCYAFSLALAAEDLSTTSKAIKHDLKHVCAAFEWEHDEVERLLWIPSWSDWNPRVSPNQGKTWRNEIQALPECKAKACLSLAIDLPSGSQRVGKAIQKQNQKQKTEAEVVGADAPPQQPPPPRTTPIFGRRNPDLMTYGPIPLWASQFRDVILPLVASHFGGSRDDADGPARAWVGELDAENQATTPTVEDVKAPARWWNEHARTRWALNASAVSEDAPCPRCGAQEGPCRDIKVCNAQWLAGQRASAETV